MPQRFALRCLAALLVLAALVGPAAALNAQRPKIGWLKLQSRAHAPDELKAFIAGLAAQGQVQGKSFDLEERYADGDPSRLQPLVAELVAAGARVIVATSQPALDAAVQETQTIPIVARMSDNPVSVGMARSMEAPGGNVTGIFLSQEDMSPVRLEQLHRAVPRLTKVGALLTLDHADTAYWLMQARQAAERRGLELYIMNVHDKAELEATVELARRQGVDGLITFRGPLNAGFDALIADLANQHGMPGIFATRDTVVSGGFMSYGPNVLGVSYGLAQFVDRILKGEPPGTIAIGSPRVLELVINLKAARTLGVTVPPEIVAGANLVVQ